jgi:TfoX/Sxy family transcriptional regulator of competence genes
MGTLQIELRSCLEALTEPLTRVSTRRMFGCDAFLAGGTMFALVLKEGRIGLKLPDDQLAGLRGLPGADAWKPGDMVMRQWVLVPETFHDDTDGLAPWVARAHAAALTRSEAPPARRKTAKARARRAPKRRRRQSSSKV